MGREAGDGVVVDGGGFPGGSEFFLHFLLLLEVLYLFAPLLDSQILLVLPQQLYKQLQFGLLIQMLQFILILVVEIGGGDLMTEPLFDGVLVVSTGRCFLPLQLIMRVL